VAGGLDEPYPPEHATLQTRIAAEGGAVVAEAPLGTAPLARHFPRRNRIVAGLSLGVVVVEAALRSGSLITARMALDAWREVFAVPGSPLDPRCRGSNDLIRQGAHLVETAEDVLANLPESPRPAARLIAPLAPAPAEPVPKNSPKTSPALRAGDDRGQVLALLGPVPVPVDDLMRRCHLSAPTLQAVLTDLELDGLVETLPGNRVALQPGVRNEASEGA
jgi:DNA processing protein